MKAIEVFKKKGLVWFEIGKKTLHLNRTKPTQKDLSISHFKEDLLQMLCKTASSY